MWAGSWEGAPAVQRVVRGEAAAQALDEIQALRAITAPGLPRMLDARREGDALVVVREWVAGDDLTKIGALGEEETALLIDSVAKALEAVHGAGFVHMDVSLGNVVRTRDGACLLDFGLAQRAGAAQEHARGTAYFVAPEVLLGLPADSRADLFALGALAARLLVGSFPEPPEAFYARFPREPFLIAAGMDGAKIPSRWRPILDALLAREAGSRLPSARMLREALARTFSTVRARATDLCATPTTFTLDRRIWRGESLAAMARALSQILTGPPACRVVTARVEEASAVAEVASDLRVHARITGAIVGELPATGSFLDRARAVAREVGLAARRPPEIADLSASEIPGVLARWCSSVIADAADDQAICILASTRPGDAGGRALIAELQRELRGLPVAGHPIVLLSLGLGDAEAPADFKIPGPTAADLLQALGQLGFAGDESTRRAFSERLLELAGADACLLESLLAAAARDGSLQMGEGGLRLTGALPRPGTIDSARALSPEALMLGAALAMWDRSAPRSTLASLCGLAEPQIGTALSELVEGRWAVVTQGRAGAEVRLAFEGASTTLPAALEAQARRALGARVLVALVAAGAEPLRRARAAIVAGDALSATAAGLEALPELRRAGAVDAALSLLDDLLPLVPPTGSAAGELLDRRAELRCAAGDFAGSESDAGKLLELSARDPLRALWGAARLADASLRSGKAAEAVQRLETILIPPEAPRELAALIAQSHAGALLALGEHGRAAAVLDRALARGGWSHAEAARLELPRSVAALRAGDATSGALFAQKALESAREADDLAGAAAALVNLGFAREQGGELEGAVAALREARELFRRLRRSVGEAFASHHLGIALRRAGEREEAEAALREALAIRQRIGDARGVAATRGTLGVLFTERGELRRGCAELSEVVGAFESLGARREEALARVRLAHALLESGRVDLALPEVEAAIAAQQELGLEGELRESRALAVRLRIAAGRLQRAEQELPEIADLAARLQAEFDLRMAHDRFSDAESAARQALLRIPESPWARDGGVELALGEAILAQREAGRWGEARDAFEGAARKAAARRARHLAVRAHFGAALAALRGGDRRGASAAADEGTLELRQIALAEGTDRQWEDVLGLRLRSLASELAAGLQQAPSVADARLMHDSHSSQSSRSDVASPSDMWTASGPVSRMPAGAAAAAGTSALGPASGAMTQRASLPDELLRTFLAINKRLNSAVDREQLLRFILDSAISLSGARRGFLALFRGETIEVEVASSVDRATMPTPARELSKSIVREAVRTGRPILTSNARTDERFAAQQSVAVLDLRSIVCVPFRTEEGVSGALYLDNPLREGAFTERTVDLVDALADQSAIALTNWLRRAEIERLNDQLSDRLKEKERALAAAEREIETTRRRFEPTRFVAVSGAMREVMALVDRVAPTDVPILLYGESGTGKDVVAQEIHRRSGRTASRLVSHNCAATPEALLESEFFGHVRGSFTGADRDRVGLVELAHRGTLFLDEVAELPLGLQAKFLRFLQDGEFRPVGARETRRADVRILSATNRRLEAAVKSGLFREDLLYRLRGVTITLPPLRERREDIIPLATAFLERLNSQHGTAKKLSIKLARALERLEWQGNIRELEHEIARLYYLSSGDLDSEALLAERSLDSLRAEGISGTAPVRSMEDLERDAILHALHHFGGNREQAAKALGISRTTIYEKIRQFGLGKRDAASDAAGVKA